MQAILHGKVPDQNGQLTKWAEFAGELATRRLQFFGPATSTEQVAELLHNNPIGRLEGNENWRAGPFVVPMLSCAKASEPSARADPRIAPFRNDFSNRMFQGSLFATDAQDGLPSGHLYVLGNGEVHSNTNRMLRCFTNKEGKALPKQKVTLVATTTAVTERRTGANVLGIGNPPNTEFVTLVSKGALAVAHVDQKHCPGTNASNARGPFQKPDKTSIWRAPHQRKAELDGSALKDASGKVEGDAGVKGGPGPPALDLVPFTWHPTSTEQCEGQTHSHCITAWRDLTAFDYTLPVVAIREKQPYVDFCHTATHAQALHAACVDQIYKPTQAPNGVL